MFWVGLGLVMYIATTACTQSMIIYQYSRIDIITDKTHSGGCVSFYADDNSK